MEVEEQELSERQKWAIVAYSNLYRSLATLELKDGVVEIIATKFGISEQTVLSVCKEYIDQFRTTLYPILKNNNKGDVENKTNLKRKHMKK
jgi:hypothetical protein